ncbi:MAG TPA: DUF6481 family protein [Xanthobacteraceae bacterium]|nr:DUF6481 family protein [Xanthobacteraceae bacterium]
MFPALPPGNGAAPVVLPLGTGAGDSQLIESRRRFKEASSRFHFGQWTAAAGRLSRPPPTRTRNSRIFSMKNDTFQDRRAQADAARKALLEKFKNAPGDNDPEVLARQQARAEIVKAREAREKKRAEERKIREAQAAAKAAEQARLAVIAEQEAKAAAARKAAEDAELEEMLRAEQKAARDERYRARKEAKKQRRKG